MATTIRELLVALGVDADTAEVKAFDTAVESAVETVNRLVDVLKWAAAGAAAVGAVLGAQAVATANSAKAIEGQANALGLTTTAYQELLYAAGRYGVEAGDLADVFGQISQLASEAGRGNAQYAETFGLLGIAVEDLTGKNPDQLLMMLAEGLSRTEDATQRLALASSILGEDSAKKLGPLLVQGAAGVTKLREEAHALGVVMDDTAIAAGARLSSQLGGLGARVDALRTRIGLALMPILGELVERVTDWYDANHDILEQRVTAYVATLEAGVRSVTDTLSGLADRLGGTAGVIALLERLATAAAAAGAGLVALRAYQAGVALAGLATTAARTVAALGPLLSQLGTLGTVLWSAARLGVGPLAGALGAMLAPLGQVLLVVGAVVVAVTQLAAALAWPVLALDDLATYLRGGDSLLGRFIERFREADGVLGSMARALLSVEAYGRGAYDFLGALGALLGEVVRLFGEVLAWAEAPAWYALSQQFAMLETALRPFVTLAELLLSVLSRMVSLPLDSLAQVLGVQATGLGALTGITQAGAAALSGVSVPAPPPSTAALAPSPAAIAGAPVTTSSTSSLTVAGNTYSISGVGISAEEALELIRQSEGERARATAAALEGAEY